jgi:uncharacterized protein YqeY
MTLQERVNHDITAAMRARDAARLGALRLLKSALTNKAVEKGRELDDAEAQQVIATLIKQRRESIEHFDKGGRGDLARKEEAEIAVLESYQPPPVSEAALAAAIEEAVRETGASSPKDMGKVMKAVMPRLAGKNADGRAVNDAVRRKLGA